MKTSDLLHLFKANTYSRILGRILVLTILLQTATVVSAEYLVPTTGLVGWWKGEGNGMDATGKHNGILVSGVGFQAGAFGQAFSFSGTANRVEMADHPDFQLTHSLSIAAWINVKASSWTIFWRGDSRPGVDPYSLALDNAGNILLHVGGEQAQESISAPIQYGSWKHVVGTLDGNTGEITLYIDGTLVARKTIAIRPFAQLIEAYGPRVCIGNNSSGGFPFVGLVDEVALYSRALSAAEIAGMYSGVYGTAPQITSEPIGQTGYWGKDISFSVKAKGTEPLAYLWHKDGFPITWATNSSLTLTNLEFSDAGNYKVVVTNLFGMATSRTATLIINPAGVTPGLFPGLTIDGVVGRTYAVQYVTNVAEVNAWTTLAIFQLTQPTQLWLDTSANVAPPAKAQRYYRVIAVP